MLNTPVSTSRTSLARLTLVCLAAAMLLIIAGSSGCAPRAKTPTPPPKGAVGIMGKITDVSPSEQKDSWGTVLVEGGEQPEGAFSDKASVTITEDTLIATKDAWLSPEDLKTGMDVLVWFEGAVAESYPIQGSALYILIQ